MSQEDQESKFTDEDEHLLRQAMKFLKQRELCQEPFDGFWEDDDDV